MTISKEMFKAVRIDAAGKRKTSSYRHLPFAVNIIDREKSTNSSIYRVVDGKAQLIRKVKNGMTIKRVWANEWR